MWSTRQEWGKLSYAALQMVYVYVMSLNMIKCTHPLSIASMPDTALVADYKSNAFNEQM